MKIGKGMIILSNQLNEVNSGLNIISNQIEESNAELKFINRNIDLQIEQQKLSNILLQNISELLRLPDNEKERQRCIELGVKFFVNAKKTQIYLMMHLNIFKGRIFYGTGLFCSQ